MAALRKTTQPDLRESISAFLRPLKSIQVAALQALGSQPTSQRDARRRSYAAMPGKLVALYEHSVFTQGVTWNIDSFDQWGVEQGKVPARRLVLELAGEGMPRFKNDSSSNNLIGHYRTFSKAKQNSLPDVLSTGAHPGRSGFTP